MNNFHQEITEKGFFKADALISPDLTDKLTLSLENAYYVCRNVQMKNDVSEFTDGTLHHLLLTNQPAFMDFLNIVCCNPIFSMLRGYFNGNFILNTYGGVKNIQSKPSYVSNIHRDIRFFSGDFPLMLQLLVLLDDFTESNGATWFLEGSHVKSDKPETDFFYQNAKRALGSKGDVYFFNSNLWHAAGVNSTSGERRALTIAFTKPFMKQQLDYCRAFGYEKVEKFPENLKQVLGYNSRMPTSLDEWYQKPSNRFYKPGQDN